MKAIIKTSGADEFFRRGREIARLADTGKPIPAKKIIAFEDPEAVTRLMTTTKLMLFREVKARPGSITEISARLHRDRSAVKQDIDELERTGLVVLDTKPLRGHGRKKEVRVAAEQVLLSAVVA